MSRDSNQAVYFQCQLCGECCSSWNIPIETHKAEALLQKNWVQTRLEEARRSLSRQSAEVYRIPLTDENVCVFLAEDRRCLIEVHEGLTLKPHECQRFPFATVRMPDGTAVHDTSAACKSVSEKLLMAFQPIVPKPEQNTDKLEALPSPTQVWLEDIGAFPATVPVTPFRKLDWQAYQTLQSQWREWFLDDSLDTEQTLKRVRHSLGLKPGLFRSSWSHKMLTLLFLRKPYRTLSWFSLIRGGSYHDPRLFGEPIQLSALQTVSWPPEQERHLKAFIWNLINRKRLLSAGGSVQSLIAMAEVTGLLVQWYAKALASLQALIAISEKDVATAIRLVERYYSGHQPRFFKGFLSRWHGWRLSHFF